MNKKKALVTGVTGQDGPYLVEYLLSKNYEVFGTYRRTSSVNFWRLNELNLFDHPDLHLIEYDLTDLSSSIRIVEKYDFDEIYNLAAQSFVGVSFEQPITTAEITGIGPVNLLEAIRIVKPSIKFYQASTSEMFGKVQSIPQTELTNFYPRSPYGVAKLYAHWMTVNYRESYNIFGCSGILFNHESPLRGQEFVTRKITTNVAKIKNGENITIELGNIDAQRDWGFAKDYVEGMFLMMQHTNPDTYILATNRTLTVKNFVDLAFKSAEIDIEWSGKGVNQKAHRIDNGRLVVKINPKFYRPAEVDLLIGDYSKALCELGWKPKTTLEELCSLMVKADIERVKKGINY